MASVMRAVLWLGVVTTATGCASATVPDAERDSHRAASSAAPLEPKPVASVEPPVVQQASAEPPEAAPAPPAQPPLLDIADAPLSPELETGAAHARASAWAKAKSALIASQPQIDKSGPVDDVLVLHALLGRVADRLGDARLAQAEFAKVKSEWEKGAAQKLESSASTDPAKQARRVGRAVTAVGEALFFFAELDRKKAEQLKAPVYRGDGSQKDVQKYIATTFVEWMKKRREATQQAEASYVRVLDIQPVPPPLWVVASAERVATMKQRFLDGVASAPMPDAWKGDGPLYTTPGAKPDPDALTRADVRKAYLDAISSATEPDRVAIRAAFTTCSQIAAKFKLKTEEQAVCDKWLADHPAPPKP